MVSASSPVLDTESGKAAGSVSADDSGLSARTVYTRATSPSHSAP